MHRVRGGRFEVVLQIELARPLVQSVDQQGPHPDDLGASNSKIDSRPNSFSSLGLCAIGRSSTARNLAGAQRAARRFRSGRTPKPYSPGLSAKTFRNVHVVMSKALHDAVTWGYLNADPTEHAVVPKLRKLSDTRTVWTVEDLGRWLAVALEDRFAGMWVLAATTGMRRSELAGVRRQMLDLDTGHLRVEGTRVVVAGRAQESDGKSAAGRREISLDSFTCAKLRKLVEVYRPTKAPNSHWSNWPESGSL